MVDVRERCRGATRDVSRCYWPVASNTTPRPIREGNKTAEFDSGESSLDDHLGTRALSNHVKRPVAVLRHLPRYPGRRLLRPRCRQRAARRSARPSPPPARCAATCHPPTTIHRFRSLLASRPGRPEPMDYRARPRSSRPLASAHDLVRWHSRGGRG